MACAVLIVIIVSLNTIGTNIMKKSLLLASLLLSLAASSAFADALLFTVNATPYDRQMTRIRPVLTAATRASGNQVSLSAVNQWMADLRSIPYGFTMHWKKKITKQ